MIQPTESLDLMKEILSAHNYSMVTLKDFDADKNQDPEPKDIGYSKHILIQAFNSGEIGQAIRMIRDSVAISILNRLFEKPL